MAEDYSYLGSGIVLIREWGTKLPFEEVGNVSAFTTAAQTNTIELADSQKGASVRVVAEGPEFWNYVLTGHYVPSPDGSLLQTRPVASNVAITEQLVVQGNTSFTELTATFDISGPVGNIVVRAAGEGQELRDVAQTQTRTATWRIPEAGTYAIVVRPYSPDGEAGVAASVSYTTAGADVPPVLVDLFDVQSGSGGVRQYTWGWLEGTQQSPDFAGVEIRYVAGSVASPDWDLMKPVGEDGYHTAAFEAVEPVAGEWTFACRSRNTSGELSVGMRVITRTLTHNLGEQIGGIGDSLEEITRKQAEEQARLDAEIRDRALEDLQYAQQAAADATAKADAAREAAIAYADVIGAQVADIIGADEWVTGKDYPAGDLVKRDGKLYRALRDNNSRPPEASQLDWELIGNYTSLGEAVAASVHMSAQNASDIQAESARMDSVLARLPTGSGKVASEASVTEEALARANADAAQGQRTAVIEARMPAGNGAVASQASVIALEEALVDETTTRAQQIDTVNASLAGKASTGAVSLLEGRVDVVEGAVTSQGQAITKVNAALTSPYVNRLPNPSFLNNSVDGWVGSSGPLTTVSSPRVGAIHIAAVAGPGHRYLASRLSKDTTNLSNIANPGEVSTFSATVNCDGTWYLEIQYYNDAGVAVGVTSGAVQSSTGGQWKRASVTSNPAPAGTTWIAVVLWADNSISDHRLALPMLTLGDAVLPFIDSKSPVTQAQALTTQAAKVTALESSAQITNAAIASLGGSGNLFENADFSNVGSLNSAVGWYWAWNPGGWSNPYPPQIAPAGPGWEPSGGSSVGGSAQGARGTGDYGVVYGNKAQAVAGKRYIISAFTANHRCTTKLALKFEDKNNQSLSEPSGNWSTNYGNGGNDLAGWEYRWLSAVAPAGTATVTGGVWVTGLGNSEVDPFFWFTRPMLELASDSQTNPSPWSPGSSNKQTASAVTTITANVNALSGRVAAKITNTTDVNGNISGTVSENDGTRSSYSILASVFRVFTGAAASGMEWQANYIRIYGNEYQLVMGTGFGSQGNLVQWFGANVGAADCTTANCIECKTTAGQTIIRGSNAQGSMEINNTLVTIRDTNNVKRVEFGLLVD